MSHVPPEPDSAHGDSILLPHGVLKVVNLQDRLAHELLTRPPAPAGQLIFRSVDLDPAEPGLGPTSPVFQEPHIETDDLGLRLMLVGQWAKVHFSGVIDHRQARPDELKIGIAARLRQPAPLPLASTFTLHATPADLRNASDTIVEIAVPGSNLVLTIEAAANARILLAEAGRAALRLQIMPVEHDPAAATTSLPPRTVRWDYAVRLVSQA